MSAITAEQSELPDVHEPHVTEKLTEGDLSQPSLPANDGSHEMPIIEDASGDNHKYEEEDNTAPVRSVVIGEEDEDDGLPSGGGNIHEEQDPYKDYDTFLYDHDYTGVFRPSQTSTAADEQEFPIIAGLQTYFGDEDFDDQQNLGARNLVFNGETGSLYRFREVPSRQVESLVERGHGTHPTTSYRLSHSSGSGSNSVVYGGKTFIRYSTLSGSQSYRTPIRDFGPSPSSPRPSPGYGSARRITLSGGGNSVPQRKPLRSRLERAYEQPGLRVMPSPTKQQYAPETTTLYPSTVNSPSFVADPMRAANDNAPAPFIVPARGSRPSLRGKGQSNRAQQPKQKTQEVDEKSMHPSGNKVICELSQKNENMLQVPAAHGQHPGRIYEQQIDMANLNKLNYPTNTLVESNRVPQSEFMCQPYQQNVEDDSRINLPAVSSAQNIRPSVVMTMDSEHLRAESPVTSIVESAHREAVRRASESGQVESLTPVKMVTHNTQEIQQPGYSMAEPEQAFDGGQQRFQNYIPYEQQQMEFYNDNSQEQYTTAGEHPYFVEDEQQRHPADDRFVTQHPQRRRLPSRTGAYAAYNEISSSRIGEPLQARVRSRGRQMPPYQNSPASTARARQLPISPSHVPGVFTHPDDKSLHRDQQLPVQQGLMHTLTPQQQQQRVQLVPSVPSVPSVIQHPQEISAHPGEQYPLQQQLQHAQLSSPEQQLPMQEQQFMPPLLADTIPVGQGVNVERGYGFMMAPPEGPEAFAPSMEQQSFANEETSSGDESALINAAQGQGYTARHTPNLALRSSVSAAEEETSFAEDNSEERGTEEEEQRMQKTARPSNDKLDEYDGWSEGDEYTTRCYCTMNHNDDFMIQCDVCNVWQHMVCMGVDRNRVPKVYKCENCNPRLLKLSVAEAKAIQLKYLEMKKRRSLAKTKAKKHEQKVIKKMRSKSKERKSLIDGSSKKFVESNIYDYSRTVAAFAKKQADTGSLSILDSIMNNETVRVMYVAQDSEGLVSTRTFRKGEPVVFVCGRVCMPIECPGREKPGSITPFVMLYSILDGQGSAPLTVCIDARRMGSTARFARRSCKPNVRLQHIFCSGKIYIFGVATEDVERGDEITLPFDPDYALSKKKLVCACAPDEENAGVDNCEIRKLANALEESAVPVQKVETGKKMPPAAGKGQKKIVAKSKILHKKKGNGVLKSSAKREAPETQRRTVSVSSDKKPPTKKNSASTRARTSSIGVVAMTDNEGVASKTDGFSASSEKVVEPETKTVKKADLKTKATKKGTSAAVKAASQKKKGAIKLKRRARKTSLRIKGASKKKTAEKKSRDVEKKQENIAITERDVVKPASADAAERAVKVERVSPRKHTRSMSAAAAQLAEENKEVAGQKEVHAKVKEEGISSAQSPPAEIPPVETGVRTTRSGRLLKTEIKEENMAAASDKANEAEVPSSPILSKTVAEKATPESKVKTRSDKKQLKKEVKDSVEDSGKIEVDLGSPGTTPLKGKRKGSLDKEKEDGIVGKKLKEEIQISASTKQGLTAKDVKPEVAPVKKTSHHRRELPEVEVMNYMLPGDRNKAETREERKMKQQLALIERMQEEKKKREERRLQRNEKAQKVPPKPTIVPDEKKAKPIKKEDEEASTERVGTAKKPRVEKKGTSKDNTEPKEAVKPTVGTRRSTRASGRDQDKVKIEEQTSSSRDVDMGSPKVEPECVASASTSPPQHPALLTAPRKRWAAAARSDSVENSVQAVTNVRSPSSGQKAYLLRRVEQQAAAEKPDLEAPANAPDLGKKVEAQVSPPKKRKGPELAEPTAESKKIVVPLKGEEETPGKKLDSVEEGHVPGPSTAPSEESREIAACYMELCAVTSGVEASEFSLPPDEFPLKSRDISAAERPSHAESSFANTSAAAAKSPTTSGYRKPTRKKMSLDEYKKRKETAHSEEKNEEGAASSKSFIPTIKDNELEVVTRRSSLRLGSIPDPAQLRDAPTASFDDLKRRIYGKAQSSTSNHAEKISPKVSFSPINQQRGRTPPETPESSGLQSAPSLAQRRRTPPPPPPPPVPIAVERPKSEPKEERLPLEERLQMLLGGADPGLLIHSSAASRPPPPPPPPLPPATSLVPRGNSRKSEVPITPSPVLGRTPPHYGSSGNSGRTRRH